MSSSLTLPILLLEQDPARRDTMVEGLSCFRHPKSTYEVHIASDEAEARAKIEKILFPFMLVGLSREESSQATRDAITREAVEHRDSASKLARRLLHHHRSFHEVKARDPRSQLRPVLYYWKDRTFLSSDEARISMLCDGAYDVVPCEVQRLDDILTTLSDMTDLQNEVLSIAEGTSWLGKIAEVLGCGVSIIDKNWKIWYCSKKNIEFSGLPPKDFWDAVCWREFHRFKGLWRHCPECPAAMIMRSSLCGSPTTRDNRCITDEYPFPNMQRECSQPNCIGDDCPHNGRTLSSYTNSRLLAVWPPKNAELKWVHVIACALSSSDETRIIGAVETVVELHKLYDGRWAAELFRDQLTAEQLIAPALRIIQWLGYARARVYRLSENGKEVIGIAEVGGQLNIPEFSGFRYPTKLTVLNPVSRRRKDKHMIGTGPGEKSDELGTAFRDQYIGCTLEDVSGNPIGLLTVDDVLDKNKRTTTTYSSDDLDVLRPCAKYLAEIVELRRIHEREKALRRHADGVRYFEDQVDGFVNGRGSVDPISRRKQIVRFFRKPLNETIGAEPDIAGYHLRFLVGDGRLQLYPGIGPYGLLAPKEPISCNDPTSMSAKCFKLRKTIKDQDPETCEAFMQFTESMRQRLDDEGRNVFAWCKSVQVLGCFPIFFGGETMGVLAVQSRGGDFFSRETVHYVELLCNVMARFLFPYHEQRQRP